MHHNNQTLPSDLKYVCSLGLCHGIVRTLALRHDDAAVVCYAVAATGTRLDAERLAGDLRSYAAISHPHLLPIISVRLNAAGTVFVIAPYTGNPEGLVTLADLSSAKAGSASPFEVERAASQLLEAAATAHASGLYHGPIEAGDVLVDPHGSLLVELYGASRAMRGLDCTSPRFVRDEIASIASLAYHLLTGSDAAEPRVRASRLVRRLDRAWDAWFDDALDPSGGFDSAEAALEALPSRGVVETRPAAAERVISTLRRVVGSETTDKTF
ncbi:MAG: hypothetical protein AAF235_01070 [Planctomycetota bacterium]